MKYKSEIHTNTFFILFILLTGIISAANIEVSMPEQTWLANQKSIYPGTLTDMELFQCLLTAIPPEENEDHPAKSATGNRTRLSFIWKIGSPLIILFLIILVWNRSLKYEVDKRTAELAEERSRLRDAEMIANIGHWQNNITEDKLVWSDHVYRILNLKKSNIKLSPEIFFKLVHPEDRDELREIYSTSIKLRQSRSVNARLLLENNELKYIRLEWQVNEYNAGKTVKVTGIIQDISERVQLEENMFQSEKMQVIGQLAGGIAHDFNNMLGGILGAAELLGPHLPDNPTAKKYQSLLVNSAERAADLTQKLLAFSHKQPIASTLIDIHNVIMDAVFLLESSIDKRIMIDINLAAEETTIIGNPTQIQNIIMNLGINASHAMENGGLISVSTNLVQLDDFYCKQSQFEITPGDYLEIEIKDNGSGIPPKLLTKIFDPFFTTKEKGKGTGLGLSAVLGTIQQHNGAITVYSELDIGTSFQIFLPLAEETAVIHKKVEEDPIKGSGTILVIDDDDTMRITAKAILENLGYTALTAENGTRGIEVFSENIKKIDLVILDMIMPVMNGHDCFLKLKKIKPDACIILASGFYLDEDIDDMNQNGLCGTIHKPFLSTQLSHAVHNALHCGHNCKNCKRIHTFNSFL